MNNLSAGIYDKELPFSIEAEQAILGVILLNPENINDIALTLKPQYFYSQRNKEIYETMIEMYDLSLPIELYLLLERLRTKGIFDSEQDNEYLVKLFETASIITKVPYYTKIIREKAFLREIISTCGEVGDLCYNNEELSTVLDLAERRFFNISNNHSNLALYKIDDLVKTEMQRLSDIKKDKTDQYKALKSEISDFDGFLGGFNKSDLVLLAARPGVGKTSFALNVVYNIATSTENMGKKSIVFFSLEMSCEQLTRRVLSNACGIDSTILQRGDLSASNWESIMHVWREKLSDAELYFDDSPNITVVEMKSKLRRMKNLSMVVIDYLQLMNSSKNINNRVQEISEITRSLKLMAKELNVPVMLLSQLSRSIEQRDEKDKTPRLSDLRDSGSIEQDADVVIFLSRPEYYDKGTTRKNVCEIFVEKNRHGKTGKIELVWDGSQMHFSSRAEGAKSYENREQT